MSISDAPSFDVAGEPSESTRVLYVEFATHFGGAVLSLSQLVAEISHHGVEPFVLTFQKPELASGLFPGSRLSTHRLHVSYVMRGRVSSFLDRHSLARPFKKIVMKAYTVLDFLYGYYVSFLIWLALRRHRIDILHTNNGLEVDGLRAAGWAGVPCVAHMRATMTDEKVGHLLRTAHRHVARSFRQAITVSEAVFQSGLEHGLRAEQMVTIYNPVDITSFDRAESMRDLLRRDLDLHDKLVLGSFGRVHPVKGQRELLLAVSRLADTFDDIAVLVVGNTSDSVHGGYWDELQEMASTPSLSGRVGFVGYQKDVAQYYHACDVIVHSATWAEAFGRVVIEGMACRKPVIATDRGGPREIITHGVDGLLVPAGDIEGLSEALRQLVTSEELRSRLGAAGRRTVEARFTPDTIAAQVAATYRTLTRAPAS